MHNTMSTKKLISTIALILAFQGCIGYKPPELVCINKVDMLDLSFKKIKAELNITVLNPNHHDIVIDSAHINVYLNDEQIGELSINNACTLPPEAETECGFLMTLRTKDVMENGIDSMLDMLSQMNEIKMEGKINGKYWIFKKELKADAIIK